MCAHTQVRVYAWCEWAYAIRNASYSFRHLVMEQIIVCVDTNDDRPAHEFELQHLRTQVAIVTSHVVIICPHDVMSEHCPHHVFLLLFSGK